MSEPGARRAGPWLLALLVLALPLLLLASLRVGPTTSTTWGDTLQGVLAVLGLAEPLDGAAQVIVELRLWRTLTTAGVGAALAYAGGLVQGLFRNGLAAPSVLGVTGGASLGATLAILALGGGGARLMGLADAGPATVLVPLAGFVGAATAVLVVFLLAAPGGRLSVPTLLLTGVAVNTAIAGLLSLISSLILDDWAVSRAVLSWTFGTLDDRSPYHVLTVWSGLVAAAAVLPFVSWELDLLQGGEDDAAALGVHTGRVRLLCVGAAALAAASAVAVAGQIAFVGLVVPHLCRLVVGRGHRRLLPTCLLGGMVFLLSLELLNHGLLGDRALQPGVVMSLVGGPFFLALLLWHRREVETW